MSEQRIDCLDMIPAELEETIERGHTAYEKSHGVVCGYRQFHLVFRSDAGAAVGVLTAYTAYAEIYVDDLWVDEGHRNRGIGSALLADLESRFSGKGYNNINLVTNAFQAVAFYEKCGFTVEFVRRNTRHPALSKTFFIKYFDETTQTQGIL